MEETKIETLNEETSDVVEEVKEAPKRRGRKPKVESAEEVKSEDAKTVESVDTPYEETVDEVQPVTNETESTDDAISEDSKPEESESESKSEITNDEPSQGTVVEDTSEDSKSLEELHEFPKSIRLSKPIMFYAAPTKHRASGLIRGTLIVKEELHDFTKVSVVIPESGRTTGYVLRSELLSRM